MLTGSPQRRFEIHVLGTSEKRSVRVWENDPDTLMGAYLTDAISEEQAHAYLSMRRMTQALNDHAVGYVHRQISDWWSPGSSKHEPGVVTASEQRFSKPDPDQDEINESRAMVAQIAIKAYEDYLADGGDSAKLLALIYKGGGRFTVEID